MSEIQFESLLACGQGEHIELLSRKPSIGRPGFESALPEPARKQCRLSPCVCDTDYNPYSNGQALQPMSIFGGGNQDQSQQTAMNPSLFSPNFFVSDKSVGIVDEQHQRPPILYRILSLSSGEHVGTEDGLQIPREPLKIVQSTGAPTHPEGRRASVLPSLLDRASKEVEAKAQRSRRFTRPFLSHRSTAPDGFTLLRSD